MSNLYALVTNKIVDNIVMWDGSSGWAPPDGTVAVLIPDGIEVDIGYNYDGTNFSSNIPQPDASALFSNTQASQIDVLSASCSAAIVGGFTSSALGATYTYPSKSTDQQNLSASVISSLMPNLAADWTTPFWCASSDGTWSFVNHTASQIQQVGQDGKAAILTCMAKNATLAAQISSMTLSSYANVTDAIAAVQKVVWS